MTSRSSFYFILLVMLLTIQTASRGYAYTYKEWSKGSGINLSINASKTEVEPGGTISLSADMSDSDHWIEWEQEDSSNPPPPEKKAEGDEADNLNGPYWGCEGGGNFNSSEGSYVVWTAPEEPGTYIISATVNDEGTAYYRDGSKSAEISIEVKGAKLSYILVKDENDGTRQSQSVLQMVKTSVFAERIAFAEAFKEDQLFEWAKDEPKWTGIVEENGKSVILIRTRQSGLEYAEAGGVEKEVTIQLVDEDKKSIKLSVDDFRVVLDSFDSILNSLNSLKKTVKGDFTGKVEWYKVDRIQSPCCFTSTEISGGGTFSAEAETRYLKPPSFPIIPFVEYGFIGKADLGEDISALKILRDASRGPDVWDIGVGGKFWGTVSGGVGAKATAPQEILSLTAEAQGSVGVSGGVTFYGNTPRIMIKQRIGELKISGKIVVSYKQDRQKDKYKNVEFKFMDIVFWPGINADILVDLSRFIHD